MNSACSIYKSRTGTSDTIKMQVLFACSSAHSEQCAYIFSFYVYMQQKTRILENTSCFVSKLWPSYPTKKQKRQNSVFMSPTSWEMRVTIACWQWGHTVWTGEVWNISPCSTVTVVAAPGGARTVAVWLPMWTNGPGPICPGMGWWKWPGGGRYMPPVCNRIMLTQTTVQVTRPQRWKTCCSENVELAA